MLLKSVVVVVVVVDRFYITLFSALMQTHCAHVASDSECMTGFLQRVFEYSPKRSTYSVVWVVT